MHFQQIRYEREKCVMVTFNDITTMHKNEALKQKNKTLNTIQSSISHEMLTPLKCIDSIVGLLKEEHEYDKQLTENLDTISSSVQFVLSQIKQKLDYALIEQGRFQLHLEPLRLVQDVIIPVIKTFKGQIYTQKVKLLVSVPDEENYVDVDKLRTQQIIINLISNALKYTDCNGEIRLVVKKKQLTASEINYTVSVQDDGPGVHPEDIEKIFSADVKVAKNQKAGHGVGLNLSSKLATYMGGELRYISNSTGAEF